MVIPSGPAIAPTAAPNRLPASAELAPCAAPPTVPMAAPIFIAFLSEAILEELQSGHCDDMGCLHGGIVMAVM